MGETCCEFTCLDDSLKTHEFRFEKKNVMRVTFACVLAVIATVVIASCLVCLCRRIKVKRSRTRTEKRASNVEFSEDLYLKMSVEMIEKNEEINNLKKKILILETQLNAGGSNVNYEHISNAHGNSWKDDYDLHVNISELRITQQCDHQETMRTEKSVVYRN